MTVKQLISVLKNNLLKEKEVVLKRIEETKVLRNNAPSRMEARYDSSRAEYEHLIATLEKQLPQMEKFISQLPQKFPVPATSNLWTIVESELKGKQTKFLFVPQGLGGRRIGDVQLLSANSPRGKELLKKKE